MTDLEKLELAMQGALGYLRRLPQTKDRGYSVPVLVKRLEDALDILANMTPTVGA